MTNSLDVFDTALFRTVYLPTDIFKLIEQEVGNNFYEKRLEAENKARERNFYYNIYDIYKFLPEFNVKTEIQAEISNCKANPKILKVYNENPSNFVFISDMYLPSKIIEEMLKKVGYVNPKVFVSCEMKGLKGDGALFKKVQEVLGHKIQKHYGDNYGVDIEGAKKAGILETEFSPALHKIEKPIPAVRDPRLKKFLAEVLCGDIEAEDKIAYLTVPLVLGFTKWVLRQRKKGQKIFFLSRDMLIPYMIAKELLLAPDVYYLHASRRSLSAACLEASDKKLTDKMRLILTEEEIKNKRAEGTEEVVKYLKKFNIQNGDLIVDIGYSGTIQAAIESILGIKMTGLYMQIFPETLFKVKAVQYLKRRVINFCLMVEVPLGSYEDCVEEYKNGKVVFKPEHEDRKNLARRMTKTILKGAKALLSWNPSIYDVEQTLIHLQYYPSHDIIEVFNKKIYSNRDIGESVINFDKDRILKGELKSLYQRSYAQKLFKQLLEEDPELKHLSSLI